MIKDTAQAELGGLLTVFFFRSDLPELKYPCLMARVINAAFFLRRRFRGGRFLFGQEAMLHFHVRFITLFGGTK